MDGGKTVWAARKTKKALLQSVSIHDIEGARMF